MANGLKSLVDYEDGAHPVFLFYTHESLENWHNVLNTEDFPRIAQSVQKFIGGHPVKGLILRDMEDPSLSVTFNLPIDSYHQRLIAYVKAIKDVIPKLEIGLYLSARIFIERVNGVSTTPYFDFSMINEIMDFYIIEFESLNECSDDFLSGGITPISSSNPNVMTLNMFAAALNNSKIAKDKIYFEFLISPKPKPEEIKNFKPCEVSYNEYCENDDDKINKWCVDSLEILYSKGQFAKTYAKGFIGRHIDLVDRDNKCNCGKYVTFDIMVQGYNGEDLQKIKMLLQT